MNQVFIYLIYVGLTTIFALFVTNKKTVFNYFFILLIALLWSTYTLVWSYEVVGDRMNYVTWFKTVYPLYANNFYMVFEQSNEIGWVIFNTLLAKLFNNEKIALYIYMFFPILVTIIFMYKHKYQFYKLHFLFCLTFIPLYCTYLCRQMFAYSFGIIAIYAYTKNKKILSLLLTIVAMLFHKTAVVILLVGIIIPFLKTKGRVLVFSMGCIVILPILPLLISVVFNIFNISKWSVEKNFMVTFAIIKAIPYLIIFFLGIKNYKLLKDKENFNVYLIMTYLCGFFWITTLFGQWYYRLNIYFLPGVVLCIIEYLKEIKGNTRIPLIISTICLFAITLREVYLISLY